MVNTPGWTKEDFQEFILSWRYVGCHGLFKFARPGVRLTGCLVRPRYKEDKKPGGHSKAQKDRKVSFTDPLETEN